MRRRNKRKYRAVIIDLRKMGKVLAFFLIFILVFSAVFAAYKTKILKGLNAEGKIGSFISFFIGFSPEDYTTLLKTEVPTMGVVEKTGLWTIVSEEEKTAAVYNPEGADVGSTSPSPDKDDGKTYNIKEVDSSQEKNLKGTDKKILLKNETNFSVDISSMLKAKMPVKLTLEGPEILILHTHATESFTLEGETSYNTSQSDRTQDTEKNIVKVGAKMAEIFRENGIETIHDTSLHDYPNYNGSYANSLKTAENYLKKYPSLKMIIDVHRDAIVYGDGTKAKVLTEIDGKKAAQLMFVIGTNAGGLEHPQWQNNLCTAVKLQSAIEKKYPGLMRGINLRKERFNEHLTYGSMILEVGTSGNTLSEALYSAQLAAKVIAIELKSAK